MTAVILAGGKGTRLHPYTVTIPKPLLPLGDSAILEVVLAQLKAAGFDRVVITLGHMPHLFMATIGNGERWGLQIEYCREEVPLGTAGPLGQVSDLEDDFLVMNGDILTTLDYRQMFQNHQSCSAAATIALHRRVVSIDYGVIEVGQEGFLKRYIEKPEIPYTVSMGVYVLSRRCLAFIPPKQKFDMPQLMMALQQAGEPVLCYATECYWQDIGRFDDYQQASEDFSREPWQFMPAYLKD
jgi:NDP-mannose synthase